MKTPAFNLAIRLLCVAVLTAGLAACGDKTSKAPSDATAASNQAPISAAAPQADPDATQVQIHAVRDDDNSDATSCWVAFTATNPGKEKLSLMAEFDAVHAGSGLRFEKAQGLSVVFSNVAAGATRGSLMPGYVQMPCDVLQLQLRSFNCVGDDCEPQLSADGIAGIADRRGMERASAASAAQPVEPQAAPPAAAGDAPSAALESLVRMLGIRPDLQKLDAAQRDEMATARTQQLAALERSGDGSHFFPSRNPIQPTRTRTSA